MEKKYARAMNYRLLGKSGLSVSEICFGVMTFTGDKGWIHLGMQDQTTANDLVSLAIEHGINFFDTADIYSDGVSESMLAKALGNRRKDVVIGTKCGFRMKPGPNGDGLSRKRIIEACNDSLRRLQTDYIDLYQIHSYDFITPLEETLSAFNYLFEQGKIRYFGVSNFYAWQLMKAISIIKENRWEKIISIQPYYSLLGRDIEFELVPLCLDQGIGIIPWGPLHGGILSGKYRRGMDWPKDTRIKSPGEHLPYNISKGDKIIEVLCNIANKKNVSASQVALNYLLSKPGITSLVTGARNRKQLQENINSVNFTLTEEEFAELDKISEPDKTYPHWYFDIFRKERKHY